MPDWDHIAEATRRDWNDQVAGGRIYTRPWLDIPEERLRQYVTGETEGLEPEFNYIYPPTVLQNLRGKRVLCLAAAGGQQSAVFALLGADVTVLDMSEAMLEGDQRAADHYGYALRTIHGDMRDLSCFAPDTFDLVYHAISLCFVPDPRLVYGKVYRVLRPGARYRVGHVNPATYRVEWASWDGEGYRISSPYLGGRIAESGPDAIEYRHLFAAIFNGLSETGFEIEGVFEDPRHIDHSHAIEEGTEAHLLSYIQMYFAIVARKPAHAPEGR
jgi:ubiquinone/menaquinone biosynthesis C-methylase UbiE